MSNYVELYKNFLDSPAELQFLISRWPGKAPTSLNSNLKYLR